MSFRRNTTCSSSLLKILSKRKTPKRKIRVPIRSKAKCWLPRTSNAEHSFKATYSTLVPWASSECSSKTKIQSPISSLSCATTSYWRILKKTKESERRKSSGQLAIHKTSSTISLTTQSPAISILSRQLPDRSSRSSLNSRRGLKSWWIFSWKKLWWTISTQCACRKNSCVNV